MDAMVALHGIHTRSKKYYRKLIFHLLDVVVVNFWLLVRRDLNGLGVPNTKQMFLQEFEMSVCKLLLIEEKTRGIPKRGRPSFSISTLHHTKKLCGPAAKSIQVPRFIWMKFSTFQKLKRKEGDAKILDAMESQCFSVQDVT